MNYEQVHAKRYSQSVEWVSAVAPNGARLYEMGGQGPFKDIIRHRRQDITIDASEGDLRRPSGIPECTYDGVLCMEVIEHIHDNEPEDGGIPTEWRATGTDVVCAEAYRILKPGGFFFLTTPNAHSINVLHKVLTNQAPMVFRPHVREYTPYEIKQMGKKAGFVLKRFETIDVWNNSMQPHVKRRIIQMIQNMAFPMAERGEDIFALFTKPLDNE